MGEKHPRRGGGSAGDEEKLSGCEDVAPGTVRREARRERGTKDPGAGKHRASAISGRTQRPDAGESGGPWKPGWGNGAGEGDGHIREIRPQISQILRKLSVYSSEQLSAPQAQKYDGNDTNEPLNTLVQTQ